MLFMGQELLEAKPWSDTPAPLTEIAWGPLDSGDTVTAGFVHFVSELIALRRSHKALSGEGCAIVHVHDLNRVLAFERWVEGSDNAVMVVCSLNETAWQDYAIGFPGGGTWRLVFNSEDYEAGAHPAAGREIAADGPPLHGRPCSAHVAIPANGILVYARG
jgi:1,4-alpha-glucan branching enzyme